MQMGHMCLSERRLRADGARRRVRRHQTRHFRATTTTTTTTNNNNNNNNNLIHMNTTAHKNDNNNTRRTNRMTNSGGTKRATSAYMPLPTSAPAELGGGKFTMSREVEPVRRSFRRRRSCTLKEVACCKKVGRPPELFLPGSGRDARRLLRESARARLAWRSPELQGVK